MTDTSALDTARCNSQWGTRVRELASHMLSTPLRSQAEAALAEDAIMVLVMGRDLLVARNVDLGPSVSETLDKAYASSEPALILARAHLDVLRGNLEPARQQLEPLSVPLTSIYYQILSIKRLVLLAAAQEPEDPSAASQTYSLAAQFVTTSLVAQHPEALAWASCLYRRFSVLASTFFEKDRSMNLAALRGHQSLVQQYGTKPTQLAAQIQHLDLISRVLRSSKDQQLEAEFKTLASACSHSLLDHMALPTAEGSNRLYEQYIEVTVAQWRSEVSLDRLDHGRVSQVGQSCTIKLLETVRAAIRATFHSSSIMRHQLTLLKALGLYDEALMAFTTYLDYQGKYRVGLVSGSVTPAHNQGDTLADSVEAFYEGIEILVGIKGDHNEAKRCADLLRLWIENSEGTSSADPLTHLTTPALATAYATIAYAFWFSSEHERTGQDSAVLIGDSIKFYTKSLSLGSHNVLDYTRFSCILMQQLQLDRALEVVKQGLAHDRTFIPLWHVLALVLSTRDDYDTAVKATNSGLDLYDGQASVPLKRHIVELKMTQVALVEASSGADVATGMVSEVFGLYGTLFSSKPADKPADKPRDAGNAVDKSRLSVNDNSLAPSKSVRSIFREKRDRPKDKPEDKREGAVKPVSAHQAKLLQRIWLWAAGLYRRLQLVTEAEQAIVEAEGIAGHSPETRAEFGLLIWRQKPVHALAEFDRALDEDYDNVRALIGLAQLVDQHSTSPADESAHAPASVFVSDHDMGAAQARVLGLLETLVHKGRGSRCAEAWWFLARFYERSDRIQEMEAALLRCVALEESRPVRDMGVLV